MKGRKPKPLHLKVVSGTAQASDLPETALQASLMPPDWMTESQRQGWAVAVENAPQGLISDIDVGLLTIWVVAEDLHRTAAEAVSKFGLITKSPKQGEPMQNPYLAILNRQAQIMMKAASELGFSPTSRSRPGVLSKVKKVESSPFAKYAKQQS